MDDCLATYIIIVSQSLLTKISIVSTNLQPPTRHYTGFTLLIRAGQVINPTRVMYFSSTNYSADFSETRGIDWTLLGASNEVRSTRGSYGNIPN